MDWMKIVSALFIIMLLVIMWPAYKHYTENGPKAKKGDWANVMLPLGGVVLLVLLLIMSVQ